jgi:hypothetical protein
MYEIYAHKDTNNRIFYIGAGLKGRAYSKKGRNKLWRQEVLNTEYTVEILHSNLTIELALEGEEFYINELGRRWKKTGNLVNKHKGGVGRLGIEVLPSTKQKIAQKCTGLPGPRKGVIVSQETKQKLSDKRKGRAPWNKGLTLKGINNE